MNRIRFSVAAMIGLLALALAGPASAGLYRIDFYEADLSGGLPGADLDGDGIVDGTGTFDAPADTSWVTITSFNATVGGSTWDTLAPGGVFPGAPSFLGNLAALPILALDGFVFEDAADVGAPPGSGVTVLQMFSLGFGTPGGTVYTGLWALSPCSSAACGGALVRGTYVITPAGTPVPAPATLPLALLALGALATVARRRAA
jgi:hypothetical protein